MARCGILELTNMNQRLMQLVDHRQVIQGTLLPADVWVVSPPIGGVSALARRLRDASRSEQARAIVVPKEAHEEFFG
eukprot:12894263-Prorocentrum_lima.AAC.1